MVCSIKDIKWQSHIGFSCYGRIFGLRIDKDNLLHKIQKLLPPFYETRSFTEAKDIFSLVTGATTEINGFYRNEERILQFEKFEESYFEAVESKIQFSLAVSLPPHKFFLHAGAVSLNDCGIIIPGLSFSGKSTLVKEFIKAGAKYYSDDCAVIDREGNLYPYSKTLSIRNSSKIGEIIEARSFGAELGEKPIQVGAVIFTEFAGDQIWQGNRIGQGKAVWNLAQNLFYPASMTLYPAETMQALSHLVQNAVLYSGKRGEAADLVKFYVAEFDQKPPITREYES